MFGPNYSGLDELDIYKEVDGSETKIVVEDSKDQRRILTCIKNSSSNDRKDRIDGEYYFSRDGEYKPYHIMKMTDSLLVLVKGDKTSTDNMYFIQPVDYNYLGHGPYKCGVEMICGSFRLIKASDLADIKLLTKGESSEGYTLVKKSNKRIIEK